MAKGCKQEGYTIVPNNIIRNENLTTETKGLLIYMLSCPPNWVFNLKTLCRDLNERRTKIEHCLKQLVENGFIKRKVVRENGKINYYTILIKMESLIMSLNLLMIIRYHSNLYII